MNTSTGRTLSNKGTSIKDTIVPVLIECLVNLLTAQRGQPGYEHNSPICVVVVQWYRNIGKRPTGVLDTIGTVLIIEFVLNIRV